MIVRTVAQAFDDAATSSGGFTFVRENGRELVVPFKVLRDSALAVGGALRAQGLGPGDHVAVLIPESDGFLTTFLGLSLAGLVPIPLAHSLDIGRLGADVEKVASFLRVAGARAIVTSSRLLPSLRPLRAVVPTVEFVVSWSELTGPALAASEPVDPHAPAMLQFTSGSTSQPRGVVLTHANLSANVQAIAGPSGLGLGPTDVGVSWLPLFHDMGLIGMALCPLYVGCYGVFLPPAEFLKRPAAWLRAITRYRGTISFAPNFAYEMCLRRVKDSELEGLDLSSWRAAGCGAEPIEAAALQGFASKFAKTGFRASSLVAAYGLAEHTLAATLAPRGRGLRVDAVRASDLIAHKRAVPCSSDAPDSSLLVGCGRPFPEHALRVVDDDGRSVGERTVGEILVSGPSVMRGYVSGSDPTFDLAPGGWLATGDLGYLADGELFVCGRRKEMIIVGGRNHFPQDIERVVYEVPGVRAGGVAAFAATAPGRPDRAVVIVETRGPVSAEALQAEVRRRVLQATGLAVDEIVLAPNGTIDRTTSGKLRRTELRERYAAGTLVAPRERG